MKGVFTSNRKNAALGGAASPVWGRLVMLISVRGGGGFFWGVVCESKFRGEAGETR